jgi:ceramide glucosyltransferase
LWPPVTVLKPVCGLERNIERNLRSACLQDYPDYQVVFSVQRLDDPALPLLYRLQRDYGPERVSVVAVASQPVVNGKVQNLLNAFTAARHDTLVISDSDVFTPPDYLKALSPRCAIPASAMSARSTRVPMPAPGTSNSNSSPATPSSSRASSSPTRPMPAGSAWAPRLRCTARPLRRSAGLEALADYLVEDYEMGRRILEPASAWCWCRISST